MRSAKELVAGLRPGGVGWARVRIDTNPSDDGWCFCTPANPPEDIARGLKEEWEDASQFFGQVVAADYIERTAAPPDGLNEDDAADLQEGRPYQDVLAAKRTAPPTDGPEFETTAEERAELLAYGGRTLAVRCARDLRKAIAERDREAAARRDAEERAGQRAQDAQIQAGLRADEKARAEQAEAREATLREKYDNLQRQWMRCANRSDEYLEALEKIADQPTAADIARAALATTSTGEDS